MKRTLFLFIFFPFSLAAQGGLLCFAQETLSDLGWYLLSLIPKEEPFERLSRKVSGLPADKCSEALEQYVKPRSTLGNVHFLPALMKSGNEDFFKQVLSRCSLSENVLRFALHHAATNGYFNFYRLLCESDFRYREATPALRANCMIKAAQAGFFDVVIYEMELYLSLHGTLNALAQKTPYGMVHQFNASHTLPLNAAVEGNQRGLAAFLLQQGALTEQPDDKYVTAYALTEIKAGQDQNCEPLLSTLKLFRKYRSKITKFSQLTARHPATMNLLKACPALASVHIKDEAGNTSLHAAVRVSDLELISLLLNLEPALFMTANNRGLTPFMVAVGGNKREIICHFIAYAFNKKKQFLLKTVEDDHAKTI